MTENSRKVLNFLKENYGSEFTKAQIAEELELSVPTVTGSVNNLVKKELATERFESVVVAEGAKPQNPIRWVTLTIDGMSFDPDEFEAKQAREREEAKAARKAEKAALKKAAQEAAAQ